MFLQFLQFGFLFSGVMFVLKASGLAPGLLAWSWLGCFTPVVIAALASVLCSMADTAMEMLVEHFNNAAKRKAAKGLL